jgi:5-methylcytosine-specific restriction protein B
MAIPKNIEKEHLLKAINKIDIEGVPRDAESKYYDLLYNGKSYPPKLVVSYANLFANGELLDRNSFGGGQEQPSFRLLQDKGFEITKKATEDNISYFDELKKFLVESKIGNLKTAHYSKTFGDLVVKVSFGQGTLAKVPWISFLGGGQSTSHGIYPVYLLYKEVNKLVLAYGVSETKTPDINWNINAPTLNNYFKDSALGDPKPYPNSFIYAVYDLDKELDKIQVDKDLNELIKIYKHTLKTETQEIEEMQSAATLNYKLFRANALSANLYLSEDLDVRFIASLITKPFVILTGLSGSGKTKLAQAFAIWICESESQYAIVPVGADWTNREPLLGFPNALQSGEYIKPDNQALDLLLAARDNPQRPHFLILDEMNLSHVERYFADFLSVMESNHTISLHEGNGDWNGIPSKIGLPKNLFIIGTVNIDETTYMFSPKVLDRANVIEFRVTLDEMNRYLLNNSPLNIKALAKKGCNMGPDFVNTAKNREIRNTDEVVSQELLKFFNELKKAGAEFGYRSAAEILRFSGVVNAIEPEWTTQEIIDAAIMQKLLPKVHGSRRKIEDVLKSLGKLCLQNEQDIEAFLSKSVTTIEGNEKVKYPLSFEKIMRMYNNLISNGFTSYAEA